MTFNPSAGQWDILVPESTTADNVKAFAYLIFAVAALAATVGVMALLFGRRIRHADLKLGSIEMAVNGVDKGEAPLIDKVRWLEEAVVAICEHIGVDKPPPRKRREPNTRTRKDDHR